MKKFIVYSLEGETFDPNGESIENCQLLGRACGDSPEEAIENLFNECRWLETSGFDPDFCLAARLHDDEKIE